MRLHVARFTRSIQFNAEELLESSTTFKVSHRMLSALEAAYTWNEPAQLTVIKDLNSGAAVSQIRVKRYSRLCLYPFISINFEDANIAVKKVSSY